MTIAPAAPKPGRPEIVKDEHLTYLDELRESGETNMYNMYGAGAYVSAEFDLSNSDARKILTYWMVTFGQPDR